MNPAAFQIDRHFLFLHADNLAVFAERVLRNTAQNPNFRKPDELWEELRQCCHSLRTTMENQFLKRKERTDAVRAKEAHLLVALEKMATHIERNLQFKSDALSSGFHLHNDHAKAETRRKQRMSVKIARLAAVG